MPDLRTHPITPLLVYEDIEAAQAFLVRAFGLTPGRLDRDQDDRVVHGEIAIGMQVIWLHRVAAGHELISPRCRPTVSGGLVVDVEDVDAHCVRARAVGARVDNPSTDQPYGRREYEARDLENHCWWFGTPIISLDAYESRRVKS